MSITGSVIGTAALNSNGQDLLFYTQSDGTISFWSNRNSNEGTDQDKYTSQDVIINTNSVTADPSVPLIAAVAYLDPEQSTHEVRVYYVGAGRKLREACRTGRNDWVDGNAFNGNQWELAEGGGLSANVAFGQLKVYYKDKAAGRGKTSVAYVNLGNRNWSRRLNMN